MRNVIDVITFDTDVSTWTIKSVIARTDETGYDLVIVFPEVFREEGFSMNCKQLYEYVNQQCRQSIEEYCSLAIITRSNDAFDAAIDAMMFNSGHNGGHLVIFDDDLNIDEYKISDKGELIGNIPDDIFERSK